MNTFFCLPAFILIVLYIFQHPLDIRTNGRLEMVMREFAIKRDATPKVRKSLTFDIFLQVSHSGKTVDIRWVSIGELLMN